MSTSKYNRSPQKAKYPCRDSYKIDYDFLKGEGPSGQEHYHDPLEQKAFRPGWKTMKNVGRAQEDERKKAEALRNERAQANALFRREHVQQRQLQNAFNPITGHEYNTATQSWQPALDPWSHHRPCVKPQPAISQSMASSEQGAGRRNLDSAQSHERVMALSQVTDQRRQRMESEGLPPARRQTGTMKEILQWS